MLDNLTLDVLEAEKAGMSYGKWKAMHPKTKKKREKPIRSEDVKRYRKCRVCGRNFEVKLPQQYICSEECRLISERNYNREFQRKIRERRAQEGKV